MWSICSLCHRLQECGFLDKSTLFQEFEANDELCFFAKKVDEFVKYEVEVFMILASTKAESKIVIAEFPLICEFLKVFPYDIIDFPPEFKVEFFIDLVPGTSHVSIDPYGMSASELQILVCRSQMSYQMSRHQGHHIVTPQTISGLK